MTDLETIVSILVESFLGLIQRVLSILKLVEIDNITPTADYVADWEQSLNKERGRRSNFNFACGDSDWSCASLCQGRKCHCDACDDRNVEVKAKQRALSVIYDLLNRDHGWNASSVQGPRYWTYENETRQRDVRG